LEESRVLTRLLTFLAVLFVAMKLPAQVSASEDVVSTYNDPTYGFALNAPDFGSAIPVIPVMFTGPAKDGFSSNVNVLIGPAKTTRKEYEEGTVAQFKQRGWRIRSMEELEISGRDAVRMEYEGTGSGRALRFLAVTVIGVDRVFVVTCTATVEDFPAQEAHFRKCLDSFKLLGK
jgi:hypothetical protein